MNFKKGIILLLSALLLCSCAGDYRKVSIKGISVGKMEEIGL